MKTDLGTVLGELNAPQLQAVKLSGGAGLILSGAGSGKTKVITARIAHLLERRGAKPEELLALTFTNKAAAEMKHRARQMTRVSLKNLFIGTFHSLCVRILKEHCPLLGYRPNFVICDEDDRKSILADLGQERDLASLCLMKPAEIAYEIGRLKGAMKNPAELMTERDNPRAQMLGSLLKGYNRRLKSLNMMDFEDLLVNVLMLFRNHAEQLTELKKKYRHVLVDEYQDTNLIQYEIVRELGKTSGNLFAVGDDDQSIYSWRGASIANILHFQKDFPNAQIIRLEQNYRSVPVILQASNRLISHNTRRMEKKLWSDKPGGDLITHYHAENEMLEMQFALFKLRQIQNRKKLKLSDFAFLYRSNHHSAVIEQALRNEGIPYRLFGGLRFFDRKEIKDAIAYLRLTHNPEDDAAFLRIVNYPKRGIGEQALGKLTQLKKEGESYLDTIANPALGIDLNPRQHHALIEFRNSVLNCREELEKRGFDEVFKEYFKRIKLPEEIRRNENSEQAADTKMRNLYEFINTMHLYQKKSVSLGDFLLYLALFSMDEDDAKEENKVQLMTVHAAKGLEFECVLLCGLGDESFPNERAVAEGSVEEERRLFYVAMTRTKQNLILTHPKEKMRFGKPQYVVPSRFLDEIPPEYLSSNLNTVESEAAQRESTNKKAEILARLRSSKAVNHFKDSR